MRICVYGASSNTIDKVYIDAVEELGRMMAERGHELVFGGGAQGLMGAAVRGVYEKNGVITGVSPRFFNVDGILSDKCTELIYTETMRERKQIMEEKSDCFIMTPGGIGTYEEFFEILTLKQLARHKKAIAVFNVNGYFDTFNKLIKEMIDGGFMKEKCRTLFEVFDNAEDMLNYLESYSDEYADVKDMKNI